ncbi:hypothetical protein DBV15_02593 [Temnothorax longispinosus]|uniref:Uncharacterized protein n=1 Tax=Temnothorax longispinosus TaxID=300112 RepID=A0A4S2KGE8_9HYME|nr:hypothetical protein DBV15_02593 [Temnothorax longispinosus]
MISRKDEGGSGGGSERASGRLGPRAQSPPKPRRDRFVVPSRRERTNEKEVCVPASNAGGEVVVVPLCRGGAPAGADPEGNAFLWRRSGDSQDPSPPGDVGKSRRFASRGCSYCQENCQEEFEFRIPSLGLHNDDNLRKAMFCVTELRYTDKTE